MSNYVLSDLLILVSFVIVMGAQFYVNHNYKKYSKVKNKKAFSSYWMLFHTCNYLTR